jgi:hypothetical protein
MMAKTLAWRHDALYCDYFAPLGDADEYQVTTVDGRVKAAFSPGRGATIVLGTFADIDAAKAACAEHFQNF